MSTHYFPRQRFLSYGGRVALDSRLTSLHSEQGDSMPHARTLDTTQARAVLAAALIQSGVVDLRTVPWSNEHAAKEHGLLPKLKNAVDIIMELVIEH